MEKLILKNFLKKHSKRMSEKYKGSGNPFYGKTHTRETKQKIRESLPDLSGSKNPFYGKTHSSITKEIIRKKSTEFANSERGREICRKGGIAAVNKRPKKTKIERIVEEKLNEMNLNFKYNFILGGKYQYDFLVGNNIILEVQGDYWHANPHIYGEGLKHLSERQLFKVERDREKKEYALSHNYKILYIWESEIYNENFSVLKEL
jgi:very-short-patch-repair endonuclease